MRGATLQRVLPTPRRRERERGEGKRRRQGKVEERSRAVATPLLPRPRALFNRPRRGRGGPRAEAGRERRRKAWCAAGEGRGGNRELSWEFDRQMGAREGWLGVGSTNPQPQPQAVVSSSRRPSVFFFSRITAATSHVSRARSLCASPRGIGYLHICPPHLQTNN